MVVVLVALFAPVPCGSTTVTFDYGAYGGTPELDETNVSTVSFDYGAYAGRPVAWPQTAASGFVPYPFSRGLRGGMHTSSGGMQ